MKSRRRVNSAVMQLILGKRKFGFAAVILVGALLFGACHKALTSPVPLRVSICQLYENPKSYDGKLIRVDATVTGLPDGTFVYPGPSTECGYSFIKLDATQIHINVLAELKPPTVSFPERKEFDVDLTGTFDSNYSNQWDAFRYRIVAVEITPRSPVRVGKWLAAA
jgi:hypothetical protein